jgi:hypothetical protein
MNNTLLNQEQPKPVFWFRVYAGCMAALYLLIALAGVVFIALSIGAQTNEFLITGIVYIPLGLFFGLGYLGAFFFKPSPGTWVYHLVLICIGFGGCPTIIAAIFLLIYYIKPEVKHYYGRELQKGVKSSFDFS